jgi:PAS domain S-box-containing protein
MQEPLQVVIVSSEADRIDSMRAVIAAQMPTTRVAACHDGQDLLGRWAELAPDIVLIDGSARQIDGLELARRVARTHMKTPLILVSEQGAAAAQAQQCEGWDCLGASEHDLARLPGTIRRAARESVLRRSLQEAEARYHCLVENTSDAMAIIQDGRPQFVNRCGIGLFGVPLEQLRQRPWTDWVQPADHEPLPECFLRRTGDGEASHGELLRLRRADGSVCWVEQRQLPTTWKGAPAALALLKDLTREQRLASELRQGTATCRALFSASPVGMVLYDDHGRLVDANPACLEIFGVAELDALRSRCFLEAVGPATQASHHSKGGENHWCEVPFDFDRARRCDSFPTRHSGVLQLMVSSRSIGDLERRPPRAYLVQFQDISKHKQAEATIQSLSQQLLKAHEIERQALACDLHDHLAQDLSSLKIGIDTLCADSPDLAPETRRRLQELSKGVRQAIMEVRDLAYHLRPACLDQFGLVQALQQYCEDFAEREGIVTEFFSAGLTGLRLTSDTEINLYRLVQEAFSNIRAHAAASRVKVKLVSSFPMLILRIEDNGLGFDVQLCREIAKRERRMGIWSMEQRVALLQGRLRFVSARGMGTRIWVEVPLKEASDGAQTDPDRR